MFQWTMSMGYRYYVDGNVGVLDVRELKEKQVLDCLWEPLGCVPSTKPHSEMNCQTSTNTTNQRNSNEHYVAKTSECQSMEAEVANDKTTTLLGELSIGKPNLQVSIHVMMIKS